MIHEEIKFEIMLKPGTLDITIMITAYSLSQLLSHFRYRGTALGQLRLYVFKTFVRSRASK